jgi:alpha-tubulin suppressor-like RCC1 family protein
MTANIAESTLCYSWGQATNGKLGNGIRDGFCDDISGFIREDLSQDKDNEYELANNWYTWQPQPIVSLLGKKIRKIHSGKEHFLALASNGKIYTWGDNSKSQLGLDPTQLQPAGRQLKQN